MSGTDKMGAAQVKLVISEAIRELMEDRHILTDDIRQVIAYAEATGNKLLIHPPEHYLAHHKSANVTYWVEYLPQDDGFIIYNTYSHRMEINEGVKA